MAPVETFSPPAGGRPLPVDSASTGYQQAIARVNEITAPLRPVAPAATEAGSGGADFAGQLQSAMALPSASAAAAVPAGSGAGARMAAIATAELGVAEQPPGSNDAPRIAQYRTATAGSGVGPWCAYFTSWVASQAGVPIGPDGNGMGYVPTVKSWAEGAGRWSPAGSGLPRVGDLVVFDRGSTGTPDHIGVVTGVGTDGSIRTVEGNSSDRVSARSYGPSGYLGVVRM